MPPSRPRASARSRASQALLATPVGFDRRDVQSPRAETPATPSARARAVRSRRFDALPRLFLEPPRVNIGSMGRRGNPYDNAKAESFMKTLKVEAVYLMNYLSLIHI